MPNTVVKLTNVESTWLEATREDRKPLNKESKQRCLLFLFIIFYPTGEPGIARERFLKERSDA